MPFIALLAREFQNALFWGPVIAKLKSIHNFTLRVIDRTPSVPGDLTLSALPVSLIFLSSGETLLPLHVARIEALMSKAKTVAIVVQSKDSRRAWERVQLQVIVAQLKACVIPAFSPTGAADAINAFIQGFANSHVPETFSDATHPAALLQCLGLSNTQLARLCEKTMMTSLSDLIKIVHPDYRNYWENELGRDVVEAVDALLSQDDAY